MRLGFLNLQSAFQSYLLMQALILAGGKGTRLQPYTTVLPKPLMPVGGYPILEIILRQLKKLGIEEIILAVGYMEHLFQALLKTGEQFGLKIRYSIEEKELGTAGPISLVIDQLEGDFLVMNGDLLTTLNYAKLLEYHKSNNSAATIALYQREVKVDFGVIESDDKGQLAQYIEKPVYTFDVSMGVNVLNKKMVTPFLQPGKHLNIPELMMNLHHQGLKVSSYREKCLWLDIGRIDDYKEAVDLFESNMDKFISPLP